ncbi:hypothetical protein [Streptomyces chryseus]|uniref:hypothetical protein n=1 Tax=Streptomyces chryseus TaxID=68186 RepID=UPI00110F759F|nr:hypothetical protein [Streptomyces chryseus]GGX26562.1 hypothetical protein GCM10010353_47000 [Streptomyces chryseus]
MKTTRAPWHVRAARKYGQTAVLYAALALSAPGEYRLAMMAGWDQEFAWLMPAVMSLYAAIGASVAKGQKEAARLAVGTPQEAEARRRSRNATTGALLALLMATAAQITWHVITAEVFGPKLWVIVVVSAVPPLVAAHVLHIDPPMELDAPADVEPAPDEPREVPAQEPQEAASEPATEPVDLVPAKSVEEPERPILRTYDEVAEALDVSPVTVRGWKLQGKVKGYAGPTVGTVRVDLRECQSVKSRRPVGV